MDNQGIKDWYNNTVPLEPNGYEKSRWFKNKIARAGYLMTLESIQSHFFPLNSVPKIIIEVGPGPGTWTKEIIKKYPNADIDLIDISSSMLNEAKKNLINFEQISYFESDFIKYQTDKQYDLFFSSRALEYISDKQAAVKKIFQLLTDNGQGAIITKNPRYWAYKLLGRKVPEQHQGQIKATVLKKMLEQAGFKQIEFYPVTFTFPFFKSSFLNLVLFKLFKGQSLNYLNSLLCESYFVNFAKL